MGTWENQCTLLLVCVAHSIIPRGRGRGNIFLCLLVSILEGGTDSFIFTNVYFSTVVQYTFVGECETAVNKTVRQYVMLVWWKPETTELSRKTKIKFLSYFINC